MIWSQLSAFILGGIISATGAWQIQGWRLGSQIEELRAARALDTAEARRFEAARNRNVVEAQNAATKRAQAATVAAASASAAAGGLRDDLAAARAASEQSAASRDQYATAVSGLLAECGDALAGMARKAQGHADDVRTLMQAWPR